jgi:DnaJ-class molecular chaperone
MICPRCKGKGTITYTLPSIKLFPKTQKCPDCDGKGVFKKKP